MASCVISKRRYRNINQNNKHGGKSIQLESQNITHHDDEHGTVVAQLDNMTQHYDYVKGTAEEEKYTNAIRKHSVLDGGYTELGLRDQETFYEELKE